MLTQVISLIFIHKLSTLPVFISLHNIYITNLNSESYYLQHRINERTYESSSKELFVCMLRIRISNPVTTLSFQVHGMYTVIEQDVKDAIPA
jgi:hypothetical protein